jgi:hypothetical protein
MLGYKLRKRDAIAPCLLKSRVYKRGFLGAQGARARSESEKIAQFSCSPARRFAPGGFPFSPSRRKLPP